MFKPTKANIDLIVRAINDDTKAFMRLLIIMNINAAYLKAFIRGANNKINDYANEHNITREASIKHYIDDLKKNYKM